MTKVDKIKEVRQLKHVKGVPIREISRRVHLSRNTIRKILRSEETKFTYHRSKVHQPITGKVRSIIEEWIRADQQEKPKYRRTANRMYDILRDEYGYTGSYESIAKCVRKIQEKMKIKEKEAYIPLIYSAGEAFQFDWTEVAAYIRGKLTTLQLAAVQLCHSRYCYLRIYPCKKQELMLDAHRRAFEYFGGACRRGIYDNLKTAVKSLLKGHHRNLQERFVRFCSHYLYEPDFCNPARGNEKGRVESVIGWTRRNFFTPILRCDSIEELNSRVLSFAIGQARTRKHPEFSNKTLYEVYEGERDKLIQLPGYGFDCCRTQHAVVSPYSTAAFDNNRYSVPTEYVGNTVQVKGHAEEVVISCEGQEIARHKRVYGYKQQIFNPHHYLGVLARKPRAFRDGLPFKNWQLPEVLNEYRRLLNDRYSDGDRYFAKTLVLLKDWPIKEVVAAVNKAVSLGVLGDSYVLTLLREKDKPIMEKEYVSIRIELERYHATQRPLSHYDRILRFTDRKEAGKR